MDAVVGFDQNALDGEVLGTMGVELGSALTTFLGYLSVSFGVHVCSPTSKTCSRRLIPSVIEVAISSGNPNGRC